MRKETVRVADLRGYPGGYQVPEVSRLEQMPYPDLLRTSTSYGVNNLCGCAGHVANATIIILS
jgi:hypothetical protein